MAYRSQAYNPYQPMQATQGQGTNNPAGPAAGPSVNTAVGSGGGGGGVAAPPVNSLGPAGAAKPSSGQGSTGSIGTSAAPGSGGISPGDAGRAADATMYDPGNPIRALRLALQAQGIDSSAPNPLVQYLMSMASGLGTSFLMKGAGGQLGVNDNTDAVTAAGGVGGLFKKFLMDALQGGGGLTGAIGGGFGPGGGQGNTMINAANAMHYDAMNGVDSSLSPFMSQLKGLLGQAGNPSQMISSMYTPYLGSYGRNFSNALSNQEDLGYAYLNGRAPGQTGGIPDTRTHDIFSYLLGMR